MRGSTAIHILLCISIVAASAGSGSGQGAEALDRPRLADEIHRIRLSLGGGADSREMRRRAAELERLYLAPAPEALRAHSRLLANPDYGIFRILPREVFDAENRMVMRGGGSYYSFSTRSHEYASATDIGFSKGSLVVGLNGANYGAFVVVEGASIETVDAHGAVEALASLEPARTVAEAHERHGALQHGVALGPFTAAGRAPVRLGAVYVLRSIVYDESDSLVALTPTRRDDDGSLVVVWRYLRRFPTPDDPQDTPPPSRPSAKR